MKLVVLNCHSGDVPKLIILLIPLANTKLEIVYRMSCIVAYTKHELYNVAIEWVYQRNYI